MLRNVALAVGILAALLAGRSAEAGQLRLRLGPEQIVQAGGADIVVPGYSVPSFVDWNNDGLKDLVVGQGAGNATVKTGKVRVYLNEGDDGHPLFGSYFFVQLSGVDLEVDGSGCMGCFPRVVDWNGDSRKDLLLGLATGEIMIFLNVGTDESPTFDSGSFIMVGQGLTKELSVGSRPTPCFVDWNNDGRQDLVVGSFISTVRLFLNSGAGAGLPPDLSLCEDPVPCAQEDGADLVVPGYRSSPVVMDLDGDGRKDILTGNTNGQLLFYHNVGTDAAPLFSGYEAVTSAGVAIDLGSVMPKPRSRPFVCDWTDDGYPDVLIGATDDGGYNGRVRLYESVGVAGDVDKDYDLDLDDLLAMGHYWLEGAEGYRNADLNHDGAVDFQDFAILLAAYNETAPQ